MARIKNSVLPRYRPVPLDPHRPAGPAPSPLVAFVHGGRWQQGSRASFGPGYAGPAADYLIDGADHLWLGSPDAAAFTASLNFTRTRLGLED